MKLPGLPFLQKREEIQKEYFLALLLRAGSIAAILFEEENKNLSLITSNEEAPPQGLEMLTSDELTSLADKVISTVEGSLPEGAELSKTIFAVPYDWVEEGKIVKDQLLKLKKVCDTLALTPIGFIISAEAIISYLQQKQGAPLTSLFVEVSGELVTVYLVKAGNVVQVRSATLEESAVKTVEQLLAEFEGVEVFPAKIVLFDHEAAGKTEQEFLSHKWPEDLPFLHIPKTENLDKDFENEAIIHGVATQMGFEVLDKQRVEEIKEEEKMEENSFGFVREQDAAEVARDREAKEAEEMIPHMKQHQNIVPVDEPVIQDHAPQKEEMEEEPEEEEDDTMEMEEEEEERRNPILGLVSVLFGILLLPFKLLRMPKLPIGKGILLVPILILGLVLFGAYEYYSNYLKATIEITTSQKTVQKSLDVSFFPNSSTSISDKTLAMNTVSVDVDGSDTAPSTGKTTTGDKAKGSVTIYNKTDNSKTFPKGATITGPNSLKFTLNDDVSVASTSAFDTSISSSNANVTAASFGTEYNLPSSSNFTIDGFSASDYFAKNGSAFSGGTKKSVTSVSQEDQNNLLSKVQDEMKTKAMGQASSQAGGDVLVIPAPTDSNLTQKKFDKKVGDQVNSFGLAAKETFKFGTYKKTDAESLLADASKTDVPQGFSLAGNKSQFDLKDITVDKDGNVKATLNGNAIYEPHLDTSTFAKQYSGKSVDTVVRSLQSNSMVSQATVSLPNKFPLLPQILPFAPSHIMIIVHGQ